MSFGTLLLYIGISILVGSISAIGMVVVFLIMLIAYVKKIEERELEMRFGEEYLAYKKETPFIIPRIFPRKS
jgi:protein-S-isoprenylcysteine O-methyltransferase Ste14